MWSTWCCIHNVPYGYEDGNGITQHCSPIQSNSIEELQSMVDNVTQEEHEIENIYQGLIDGSLDIFA